MIRVAAVVLALFVASCATTEDATKIPHFDTSVHCSDAKNPPPQETCQHLDGLEPLQIPLGGRIYRETWEGPFAGPTGRGSIVLKIDPDGTRTIIAPWLRTPYLLKPYELRSFEAVLARSDFGKWGVYNRREGVCVDGVATALEAIVDGKYRLVFFDYCGGVMSDGIADALDQLFVFAADKAGLRYPVNPDHPTYRGY